MDTPMDSSDAPPVAPVVFRGKKRKAFRQRPTDGEAPESASTPAASAATVATPTQNADAPRDQEAPTTSDARGGEEDEDEEEEGLSVADIIRQRNARKSRLRGGVGFGADDGARVLDDDIAQLIREGEQKALDLSTGGMTNRFTVQTGFSTELVNKHMTEYVESELAKRKAAAAAPSPSTWNNNAALSWTPTDPSSSLQSSGGAAAAANNNNNNQNLFTTTAAKHSALQGRLMEVDLGDEVRSRNEALTDRARRRLQGEAVDEDEQGGGAATASQPAGKVRLGRDGKPWRPRNRRGSDAIKRDQLVEEFLKENRLDVYEAPTPPPAAAADGEEDAVGAADERIAEEFRREFMDAMAQRRKKKRPAQPAAKRVPNEDVLRGPKLGGSRNTRAAMRDILLKKEKEAAKR